MLTFGNQPTNQTAAPAEPARTVEIIVHCYAEKRAEFAKLLNAQIGSVLKWPPKCKVILHVVSVYNDQHTTEIIHSYSQKFQTQVIQPYAHIPLSFPAANLQRHLRLYHLPKCDVMRRSVARNIISKKTSGDVVWFADCDYVFGEGCLDALAACEFKGLAYPGSAMIHKSHQIGDAELARSKPGELTLDLSLFEPWRVKFAIGGLQIVDGATARLGYLDGSRWSKPVPDAQDFLDTKEDRIYRGKFEKSTKLTLPNLYRLRHSASAFESPESRLKQTAGK